MCDVIIVHRRGNQEGTGGMCSLVIKTLKMPPPPPGPLKTELFGKNISALRM